MRVQKILDLLIENKNTITGEFLCNNLGVSSRTIRSDIKELNKIIEKNGATIVSEKSKGYKLEILDKELFDVLITSIKGKDIVNYNTSAGRNEAIIAKLLINNLDNVNGITQNELADSLYISLSSLKNDMKNVKDILSKYDLEIVKMSNKGIGINGQEEKIRACIKKYLYGNKEVREKVIFKVDKILESQRYFGNNLEAEGYLDKNLGAEEEQLDKNLGEEGHKEIENILKDNIAKFNFKLCDKALKDITSFIMIMILRNNTSNTLEYNKEHKEKLNNTYRYKVARTICDDIYEKLHIKLSENEVYYLTKYLLSSSSISFESSEELSSTKEYALVNKILIRIRDTFNINFLDDKVLMNFLCQHLKASIYRAQYDISIENSLLSAIKSNYPFALELAVFSNDVIKDNLNIDLSEDDIGFLALHFAAANERLDCNCSKHKKSVIIVCENGIGASLLIKVKLETKFKDKINIVDTIPRYEFNEVVLNSVDLVITTVNLSVNSDKVVHLKCLLDNNEMNIIEDKLSHNLINNDDLSSKFKEELFYNKLDCSGRSNSLEIITNDLINKGYINENVKERLFIRESIASTEIGDLVAIPHDMSEDIKESFIAVAVLKKAVTWEKEKVQVIFLIGMSHKDKEEWKSYLERIYKNIIDIDIIKRIIKCKDFNEVKKVISEF